MPLLSASRMRRAAYAHKAGSEKGLVIQCCEAAQSNSPVLFLCAAIVYVVLHPLSAHQSSSPSRMQAGGLVLTEYHPYAFLHS